MGASFWVEFLKQLAIVTVCISAAVVMFIFFGTVFPWLVAHHTGMTGAFIGLGLIGFIAFERTRDAIRRRNWST